MFDEDLIKYGLIDSLVLFLKIILIESMDGMIGDVYNKEVRCRVMDQFDINFILMCVYDLVKFKF